MKGYNYRLPNINAALGCAQMGSRFSGKSVPQERYRGFSGIQGISVFGA
jgi:hypothetical protein